MTSNNFTISLRAKFGDSTYAWQRLFGKKGMAAAANGYSIYYGGDTRKLMWSTANGTASNEYRTNASFSTGDWHHIVMVRNNADPRIGYFYVDGIRQDITTIPSMLNVSTSEIASIGAHPSGLNFKGSIDEVRVYNRALSSGDIQMLYTTDLFKYAMDQWTLTDSMSDVKE